LGAGLGGVLAGLASFVGVLVGFAFTRMNSSSLHARQWIFRPTGSAPTAVIIALQAGQRSL
jgi:hypothetical protein